MTLIACGRRARLLRRPAARKEYYDNRGPDERERAIVEEFKARIPDAEITDARMENVSDPVKPPAYTFRVRAGEESPVVLTRK